MCRVGEKQRNISKASERYILDKLRVVVIYKLGLKRSAIVYQNQRCQEYKGQRL